MGDGTGQSRPAARRAWDALEYLILLVVLALLIVLVVHPWIKYFTYGLPTHWDPPNHAAHQCWNAHNILHGYIWRPLYDKNFLYPHALTLAFDEAVWPPSFFSAIIYGLSGDPILTWNATALFVWALSGVTMYAFLRELPVSRGIGYLGAAAFCLLPYRLAYYVELNMIYCFAIPLVYLFFIRWLRRQRWLDAILLGLAFWISASTHLYYTTILTVPMPFILLGFLVRRPELLRGRRFYLSGALAAGLAIVLCVATLYPFLVFRFGAHYERTIAQQERYSAQPLTYLRPSKTSLVHGFLASIAKAERAETVIFPGITIYALACLYWFRERLIFRRGRLPKPLARPRQALAATRAVMWFVFASLVVYGTFHTHTSSFAVLRPFVVPSINAVFWLSFALLFLPTDRDPASPRAALSGLAVGAVACFILSFGPELTLGLRHGGDIVDVGQSAMARLYKIVPFFSLMRVTTRFSIIVLLFLITAGCFALDVLLKKAPRLHWLWAVPLALIVFETCSRPYAFTDWRARAAAPVQRYLREQPTKVCVVQIPFGLRDFDSLAMMDTVGKWNYLINGWAGFMPEEHQQLGHALNTGNMAEAAEWLREIWPEVYLVVDFNGVTWWKRHDAHCHFTEQDLEPYWHEVMRDDLFALYRLNKLDQTPPHLVRRLRTDVLRAHPCLCFRARTLQVPDGAAAEVRVQVNGHEIKTLAVTDKPRRFEVLVPRRATGNLYGEEVSLTLEYVRADRVEEPEVSGLWEVDGLDFATKARGADCPADETRGGGSEGMSLLAHAR